MKTLWLTAGILAVAGTMTAPARSEAGGLGIVIVAHNGYRPGTFRVGYDRGYNDGLREGAHDGRRHEVFSYWDEARYRNCGYNSGYGARREYQSGYRGGFQAGYRQAYYASYRCERHDRARCHDRGCDPAYRTGHSYADDDWAYKTDSRRHERDDDRYEDEAWENGR